MRARLAPLGALALLAGCGDRPDESGLTAASKKALVERYYACAARGDFDCVTATLHPRFADATAREPSSPRAHAKAFALDATRNRFEATVNGGESGVWAVELWTTKSGKTYNLLRSFDFAQGKIVAKRDLTAPA
ncbi:MAG: hypothetical protein INF91_11740 [Alphaproteobacteria bacterium]|nr:hypothetical protein [Alphaproteobacteria bacterium]